MVLHCYNMKNVSGGFGEGGKSHHGGVSGKAEPSTIGGSSCKGEREYGLRDYCGALYINSISIHFIKIQGA